MKPKQSGPDGSQPAQQEGGGWIFPTLLLTLLVMLIGIAKWNVQPQPVSSSNLPMRWTPSDLPAGEIVSLEIDFGNGATKQYAALAWRPEMTAADLLEEASKFRPGVAFEQIGDGASGFLKSLDGLANQGVGGRNWIYQVDGELAEHSFCLEKLQPGEHILWTFTDELYNDEPE